MRRFAAVLPRRALSGSEPRLPPASRWASSVASRRLSALFSNSGGADYIGEPVSIAAHSLQAAALAAAERPYDRQVIAAALLHDVGHLLGLEAGQAMGMDGCGVPDHEHYGAAFLRALGLPERVSRLVGAHVAAKRFLCWRDPAYFERLSEASRTTLRFQGGPMTDEEGRAWDRDADRDTYLRMRRWDELAKEPDAAVPDFSHYAGIIDSLSDLRGDHAKYVVSDAQRAFWLENGYLVLKGLTNYGARRDVATWAEEISQWPKAEGEWLLHWESATGDAADRIFCRAENFVAYHEGMRELARGFLNDVVAQEKINYKLPNGSGFAAHQDTPAYLRMGGDRHVSAMVAIDASTAENGALEVAAGRWGAGDVPLDDRGVVTPEAEAQMRFTPLLCEAGDVVLFDGWLPHRSARNGSDRPRRAVFFTYGMERHGDKHAEYYAAKHEGARGFDAGEAISFQGDFMGKIVA